MVCVVIKAEQSLSCMFLFSVWYKNFREIGSTPVEGSSNNKISLPPIKASATQSLRLLPPLNLPALVFTNKPSYIVCMKYWTASSKFSPFKPFILPKSFKCSNTVRFSQTQSNYGHIPTCFITSMF